MGLIKAIAGAVGGVLADQWRDYFYCDSIDSDTLIVKGQKRAGNRSSNTKGSENVISNGSIVAVNEGQFMMIVDQGKVVDFTAEAGEYVYDTSTEPSMFYGGFGKGLLESFKSVGARFTFGGEAGKDHRVYFFNTKEIIGNKYGTPNPIPFRVVDQNIGLDMDAEIRCHGEYSYKIVDPLVFYSSISGNVTDSYNRSQIDSQLKTELMTSLQPAFAKISAMGIRYSALPGHTEEISQALNEVLSEKWKALRGLAVASFGISSVTLSEEYTEIIKEMQRNAVLRTAGMADATMTSARADALRAAASNESTGPMMAFAAMNMATNAGGMYPQQPYAMPAPAPAPVPAPAPAPAAAPAADAWTCSCGATATGKFCSTCGAKKPEPKPAAGAWTCSCGAQNSGKFCSSCGAPKPAVEGWTCKCGSVNRGAFCPECGSKKPVGEPLYQCDKCGWKPEDPKNPPKFCPECGDRFDEGDIQ